MVLPLGRRAVAYAQRHVSNLIGIQSKGRQATLKHLVCNDSETSRREYDVQVDERVLREVYLRPFEIAVKESDPSSIMAVLDSAPKGSGSEKEPRLTPSSFLLLSR
jgi:beta-glucosidase-like glycosyl hydrolase